jgi:hypothetical protein
MANANVMAASNRLKHALKALEDHWLNTRETWNDSVRQRFEDRHLKPLDPATDAAAIAMYKFGEIVDRLRRDLSDRSELS